MTRRALPPCVLAGLLAIGAPTQAAEPAADSRPRTIGLVPSADARITAALADGARLALDVARRDGGPRLTLVVGREATTWSSAAQSGVRLATRDHAAALITPPERSAAHALAQVGTRCRIAVVATSDAPSVTRTGSTWVLAVVPRAPAAPATRDAPPVPPAFDATSKDPATVAFVRAFRARFRRSPTAWNAVGYDAATTAAEVVRRAGPRPSAPLPAAATGAAVLGATGPLRFDRLGRRVESHTARRSPARRPPVR